MIRVTREELRIVIEAGKRVARRTGGKFKLDWSRIQIIDDKEWERFYVAAEAKVFR